MLDDASSGSRTAFTHFATMRRTGFVPDPAQKCHNEIGAPAIPGPGGGVTTTINETIDGSVFERWNRNASYRPKNLEYWARRNNVDIRKSTVTVLARDGSLLGS